MISRVFDKCPPRSLDACLENQGLTSKSCTRRYLASEVRLNVDLDVALTVVAHGCYRWLASRLRGFEKAKPKQLYRWFVETGGVVEVEANRVVVRFDKRSHNPILREAALDRDCPGVPWLRNLPITFEYP